MKASQSKFLPLAATKTKRMKRILALACMVATTGLFAQKSAQVTAYNYMKDKEFIKAYEYITKAEQNDKTANDAKTYFYKGSILLGMATSPDIEQRTFVEDALDKGIKSWNKSLKLDEKERYSKKIRAQVGLQRAVLLDSAGSYYQEEKYEQSGQMFAFAAKLHEIYDTPDSSAVFNTALAYENAAVSAQTEEKKAELYETAAEYYQKALEIPFEPETCVLSLVRVFSNTNQEEKKLAAIDQGLEMYPNNQGLILEKLNFFLTAQKYDEAAGYLTKAISNEPDNEILHFALGVAYDNMGKLAEAEKEYKKALELKPDYFDAAYNLGAMVYNAGVELNNQANELDFRTKGDEIDALNEKANVKFKEAIKLLESAHELNPEDAATITSLSQLYVRLGMNEKYKEMKAKM